MRALACLLVLGIVPAVAAKELPDGIKISVDKSEIMATQKGTTVRLARGEWSGPATSLVSAELSGDAIVVTYVNCMGDDGAQASFPLDEVRARLENSRAMVSHRAKEYAKSEAGFRRALQQWPSFDLAAVNLASALAMQGKKKDAAAALVPLAQHNPAWVAWRLDADPELAAIKSAPELIAVIHGVTPGGATVAQLENDVAWDSDHKLISTVAHAYNGGPGGPETSDLVVLDTGGHVLARLPLTTADDYDCSGDTPGCKLRSKGRAAAKKRAAEADRMLHAVGLITEKGALRKTPDSGDLVYEWKADTIRLAEGKDGWEATRAGKIVGKHDEDTHVRWAALVPGYIVVSWVWQGGEGCMGVQPEEFTVIQLAP